MAPNPQDVPLPEFVTGVCRIHTPQPGFQVLVDFEPARDAAGALLLTPCEFAVTAGSHTVTVAKAGFVDESRVVSIEAGATATLEFQPSEAAGAESALLSAPYFTAKVGEPVPLVEVNSPGDESDPFVTADGLTLWFAGDRREGRGIFVATRPTPYHPFSDPEYQRQTRSPDRAASPSLTADALSVVYAQPEKGRIYAVSRTNPFAEFSEKTPVQFTRTDARWPAAQILGDGRHLYWNEVVGGAVRTFVATRKQREQAFGEPAEIALPGGVPCLSADGLRQYVFDGRVLRRARRVDLDSPFSQLEEIATLELPGYVAVPHRRQFWVSDDEQWLYYATGAAGVSDLFLVRIAERRRWGFVPTGKPIPPRPAVVAKTEPMPMSEPEDVKPAEKPADPRTLPLPYVTLREQLQQDLAKHAYDAARERVQAAMDDRRFAADRELLEWDLADVERLATFQADARRALAQLKPGAELRIGTARVEFVKFDGDTLTARAGETTVEKKLGELRASDLVALVDDVVPRSDAAGQLRIGTFLWYDPTGNERLARARFERAGEEGEAFVERIARRELAMARREIERDNAGVGLAKLKALSARFPDSETADEAQQAIDDLYRRIRWEPRGTRRWDSPTPGEYVADTSRANGSYLLSPREYENFELRLEWKVTGRIGQGGVYFRYAGDRPPSTDNAFKLHLANDRGLAPDMYTTGALLEYAAPDANAAGEAGEWNTLVLRVEGEKVEATINGRNVLTVAAQDPEIPRRGFVALDGEVGGIAYRKILLLDLPETR